MPRTPELEGIESEWARAAKAAWHRLGVDDPTLGAVELQVMLLKAIGYSRAAIAKIIRTSDKVVDQRVDKVANALLGRSPDHERLLTKVGLVDLLREVGLVDRLHPDPVAPDAHAREWDPIRSTATLEFVRRALIAGRGGRETPAHDTLERLGWPGVLIQGNCELEYRRAPHGHVAGRDDIVFAPEPDADEGYRGPTELRDALRQICDARWEEIERSGAQVHNRPFDVTPPGGRGASPPRRIRATNYIPGVIDRSARSGVIEGRVLEIRYQTTWYWYALGTNFALAHPARAAILADRSDALDRAERSNLRDLRGSILANPLSVNIAVVLEEPGSRGVSGRRWVLVQERGPKAATNTAEEYRYQISGAGFVDVEDRVDLRSDDPPDPWVAAARETEEETGLRVDADRITFLGLARDRIKYEVGLFGFVRLTGTPEQTETRPPRERGTEVSALRWWAWEPGAIVQKLTQIGGDGTVTSGIRRFLPLGAIALLGTLIHDFGDEVGVGQRRGRT